MKTETVALLSRLLSYSDVKEPDETASRLLSRFGSLSSLLSSDPAELTEAGLSPRAALLLSLAAAIPARAAEDVIPGKTVFDKSDLLAAFFVRRFLGASVERVCLLLLDAEYRPLALKKIAEGAVNSAAVELRSVTEAAVLYDASFAVLAHNHPRGKAAPSRDDELTTSLVSDALSSVGVKLIEHYVVAGNAAVPVLRTATGLPSAMPDGFYERSLP